MENKNVFTTPVYSIEDFGNKAELERHLEFKIESVIEVHATVWGIDRTDREITGSTASAKIFMTRK